jgi:octaprenyl-diphosphate synthase
VGNSTGSGRAERVVPGSRVTHAEIYALVAEPLIQVEAQFREHLASPVAIVDELGSFVAGGGGKRVRPTLHLMCTRLCAYDGPHDVLLATVLEFIHCATLIHDDIIDEASVRRGRPSVNEKWGNNVTVLFGDYLFAKAMQLALRADNLQVMEKLAEVTLRMTEGEMLQTRYAGRIDLTEPEYVQLIEKKTASLFGCCCELAGILAGESDARREALRRYGLYLGLAFQVVDDLLDFTGDLKTLGKPAASDLREGKATLSVIDALSGGNAEIRQLVEKVMATGEEASDDDAIVRLTERLHDCGAVARSQERARDYAARAEAELAVFEDSPARHALLSLPDLLLDRDR